MLAAAEPAGEIGSLDRRTEAYSTALVIDCIMLLSAQLVKYFIQTLLSPCHWQQSAQMELYMC